MKIELAHDFIARKIYEEASIEDKARARATKLLTERYQHFLTSENLLLTAQELSYIDSYQQKIDLTKGELNYIKISKKSISNAKLKARIKDAIFVAIVCILVFSSWGLYEHQRYSNTFAELTDAKDSINYFRNMQGVELSTIALENATPPVLLNGSEIDNFSTIMITGIIKNEQDQPISKALIRVMGAEVLTNENGFFELYLALAPQYLKEKIQLQVTKTNYNLKTQLIDVDLPKNELQLVLTNR